MHNDVKHVAAVSLVLIGLMATPNSATAFTSWDSSMPAQSMVSQSVSASAQIYEVGSFATIQKLNTPDKDLSWLDGLSASAASSSGDALLFLFKNIDELLAEKDFDTCDRVLATVDCHKVQPEILVGLLRFTSFAKDILPSWRICLGNTANVLRKNGLDSDKILKGLEV